jgi:hypothetical protein
MSKPLIFISHKHADKDIALTVAQWVQDATDYNMDVYLSSHESFKGPRFGREINKELRTALWNCDALILIYTTEDREWSYCLWECGVANDQASPDTTMIVFQFSDDMPKVLTGTNRVDARQASDIRKFSAQLFTDAEFFPSLKAAHKPNLPKDVIHAKADALFAALKNRPDFSQRREWQTWPYLQIEMPVADVERARHATAPQAVQIVRERATVALCDPKALDLFGLAAMVPGSKLDGLLEGEATTPDWFRSCCEQVAVSAAERLPTLLWTPIRKGMQEYIPAVSRVRQRPAEGKVQFDLYFYDLPRREMSSVKTRMLTPDRFFWKSLGQAGPHDVQLAALNRDLRAQAKNRVPFLDAAKLPKYIVHRSAITEHLADNGAREDLTLADLLTDAAQRELVENSFATIRGDATLAEAAAAMRLVPNCRDVFVTEDGTRNTPVIGWLTNVDLE